MKISKTFLGIWIAVIVAFIVVLIVTTTGCNPVPATDGIPKVPLDTTIVC